MFMTITHSILFFFFNDTATTEIYTLSLHDALPISSVNRCVTVSCPGRCRDAANVRASARSAGACPAWTERSAREAATWSRSEEHTSELQSRQYLVCRLLLEKKKNTTKL